MTSGLKNPLTLMSYVAPVMAVASALLSLALDPWEEFRENEYFDSSWHITRSCFLMFFGGTLAFFMVGVYFPSDIYFTSYLTCLNLILLCLRSYFSTYRICLSNTCIFIFLQVLTEYILVSVTSAVTVTIAGVVKEAVTILVSINFYIIYIF